jgi:hypothetical protein
VTETRIVAELVALGYTISVPVGNCAAYDLILDDGTARLRVQCKTGQYKKGAVLFKVYSEIRASGGRKRVPYGDKVDAYAVYCPKLSQVYLIPAVDVKTHNECSLRVEPMKVATAPRTLWAKKYKLGL